jgi:hypothetical protein
MFFQIEWPGDSMGVSAYEGRPRQPDLQALVSGMLLACRCGNQAGGRMNATTAVVHSPWLLE